MMPYVIGFFLIFKSQKMEKEKKAKPNSLLPYARIFSSRSGAFILACMGVVVQIFHNWMEAYSISSFDGGVKIGQAVMIALFLSCALLYFTLLSDGLKKKVNQLINVFFYFEMFLNLHYYAMSLVVHKGATFQEMMQNADWGLVIIAVPFSIIIPYALKSYAGEIEAHQPEDNEVIIDGSKFEEYKKFCDEQFETFKTEMLVEQTKFRMIFVDEIKEDVVSSLHENFKPEISDELKKELEDLITYVKKSLETINISRIDVHELLELIENYSEPADDEGNPILDENGNPPVDENGFPLKERGVLWDAIARVCRESMQSYINPMSDISLTTEQLRADNQVIFKLVGEAIDEKMNMVESVGRQYGEMKSLFEERLGKVSEIAKNNDVIAKSINENIEGNKKIIELYSETVKTSGEYIFQIENTDGSYSTPSKLRFTKK